MTDVQWVEKCKELVKDYVNNHLDRTDDVEITVDDIHIVWQVKVLQNWKAFVSTTLPDGMYYELTHNGDTSETYVDCYKKWDNFVSLV